MSETCLDCQHIRKTTGAYGYGCKELMVGLPDLKACSHFASKNSNNMQSPETPNRPIVYPLEQSPKAVWISSVRDNSASKSGKDNGVKP